MYVITPNPPQARGCPLRPRASRDWYRVAGCLETLYLFHPAAPPQRVARRLPSPIVLWVSVAEMWHTDVGWHDDPSIAISPLHVARHLAERSVVLDGIRHTMDTLLPDAEEEVLAAGRPCCPSCLHDRLPLQL